MMKHRTKNITKPDVESELHHHFKKYSMPTGSWILWNQQKFDQYQLGIGNQLNHKLLCNIPIMIPDVQNLTSICYNIGKIDI